MPALIRVDYQLPIDWLSGEGLLQHVHDHSEIRVVRDRIAYDFSVVHVQYRRQIAFVLADVYLGHVGSPLLVWSRCGEVPVDYVRGNLADVALVGTVLATPAYILQILFLHETVYGLVVDREALVPQFIPYATVAVTALVMGVYGPDPLALFRIAVRLFTDVVVVCGAGKPACLQEMFERMLAAQFSDCLGPIPNISAFSSWSRAFNFFR